MPSVKGRIVAISHIFYLSGNSKSFFIQLRFEETRNLFILVPVTARTSEIAKIWRDFQTSGHIFIGRYVTIKKVKMKSLAMTDRSVKIFMITDDTTVEFFDDEEPISNPFFKDLVSYEGIVTNDSMIDFGLCILDNKAIFCFSAICVITNVRKVQKGFKVSIDNAHYMKLNCGFIGLILCAKGRFESEDFPKEVLHPPIEDQRKFESNYIIQKCLNLKLSSKQIIQLFSELKDVEKALEFKNLTELILNDDCKKIEQALDFFNIQQEGFHSSLLNDFLTSPHRCRYVEEKNLPQVRVPCIEEFLKNIKEVFEIYPDGNVEDQRSRPCSYRFQTISSSDLGESQLLGLLKIDAKSGFFYLSDKNDQKVTLIFTHKSDIDFSDRCIVKLTNFVACKEQFKVGSSMEWSYFYLIVSDLKKLYDVPTTPLQFDAQKNVKWSVKFVSHPMIIGKF